MALEWTFYIRWTAVNAQTIITEPDASDTGPRAYRNRVSLSRVVIVCVTVTGNRISRVLLSTAPAAAR